MDESDLELVERYRKGRVDALAALVDRYRKPLYGFIVNMTEGRTDADDVFQEVWLRAIRKLPGYRHDNFCGWLVRIARNLIIDRARRRKPDLSLDQETADGRPMADLIPGSDPGAMSRVSSGELGRRIQAAVGTLPKEQREVFLMRVSAEIPFKEIARIQKTSIGTALARMHYALAKLRPLLESDRKDLGRG